MDRRVVLLSGLAVGSATAILPRLRGSETLGFYGPLSPVADAETGLPLLKLPAGFEYRSFGWTGDPMSDGSPTPNLHDGMTALRGRGPRSDSFVLMRNHERGFTPRFGNKETPCYDAFSPSDGGYSMSGGTTALVFTNGRFEKTVPTLTGTLINCAGGSTPWNSWLTWAATTAAASSPTCATRPPADGDWFQTGSTARARQRDLGGGGEGRRNAVSPPADRAVVEKRLLSADRAASRLEPRR